MSRRPLSAARAKESRETGTDARERLQVLAPVRRLLEVGRRFDAVALSHDDEEAYALIAGRSNSRSTAVGMGLLLALVVLQAAISAAFHPEGLPDVADLGSVWIILSLVAAAGILYQKLPGDIVARGVDAFGVACMIVTAWAVMTTILESDAEPRRLAFGLVEILLIVIYMLFRFRPFYAGFAGVTATALCVLTFRWQNFYHDERLLQVAAYLVAMNGVGLVVSVLVERQERQIFLTLREIERESLRADQILRSILPESISNRLKEGAQAQGETVAESHPEVTILHADLVGFTALAAELPPAELVAALDALFSEFDRIVARHDVEKMKTEGDAYIAAAGVPIAMHHHALRAAAAALDLVEAVRVFAEGRGFDLGVRIGLDSGAVVTGIVGKQKSVYDLWGSPVAGAARIESAAEPGTVLVSAAAAERLEGYLPFAPGPTVRLEGGREVKTFALLTRPRHLV